MARLIDYLSLSGLDPKTNKFRTMNIGLVKRPTEHKAVVTEVLRKYDVVNEIDRELNRLNKELQIAGQNKLKFDYVVDEAVDIDKAKLKSRLLKKLKLHLLETNDKFSKVKTEIENKSKNQAQQGT